MVRLRNSLVSLHHIGTVTKPHLAHGNTHHRLSQPKVLADHCRAGFLWCDLTECDRIVQAMVDVNTIACSMSRRKGCDGFVNKSCLDDPPPQNNKFVGLVSKQDSVFSVAPTDAFNKLRSTAERN